MDTKTSQFMPPSREIKFAVVQEPVNVYRLEDGTEVRVRLVLMAIEDTGRKLPDGSPEVKCAFQQVMHVQRPEMPK